MRRLFAQIAVTLALLSACGPKGEPTPGPKTPSEPSPRNVVLFLGDSLTAGYGVAIEDAFPALLDERWRKEGVPLRARNAGVSGATTAGVLETLDWTLAADVRTVFVCVGGNDGLRGLDLASTHKNIAAIIEKSKAKGVEVVLAGMKIPPNYGKDYAGRFERLFPELAKQYGLKLMPFLLDGVGGRPKLNIPDGIHPNEEGHKRVASGVHDFLKKEGVL